MHALKSYHSVGQEGISETTLKVRYGEMNMILTIESYHLSEET